MGFFAPGFEALWGFEAVCGFCGRAQSPDNMKTIVTTADACNPTLNQAFVGYVQARGFVVDPARVRSPQDKPRAEHTVAFVQGSFWGGDFGVWLRRSSPRLGAGSARSWRQSWLGRWAGPGCVRSWRRPTS